MIPPLIYSKHEYTNSLKDSCCICKEELSPQDSLVSHTGLHVLHSECAIRWMERCSICPLCKCPVAFKEFKPPKNIYAILSGTIEKTIMVLALCQLCASIQDQLMAYSNFIGHMDTLFPN